MANVGRPKKEIDMQVVGKLASIMCTQEEIANYLEVNVRTLQRNKEFCRIYKKHQDEGKMSLRRWQFKHAEKNPAMAIYLGKVLLGQRENAIEVEIREKPKLNIEVVDNSNLEKIMYEENKK